MMVRPPLCFDPLEEPFLGPKGSLKSLDSQVSDMYSGHFFWLVVDICSDCMALGWIMPGWSFWLDVDSFVCMGRVPVDTSNLISKWV